MKILVCIKQVPESNKVEVDPVTGVLKRDGAASKMNPYDLYALETALRIRKKMGGSIHVISMGPPQAMQVIREAYSMGADSGTLLSDRKFGGADVLATSYTLAQGIKACGTFDLVLCGRQTTDGDTAQVGPEIAEHLGYPQVTYVSEVNMEGEELLVKRESDQGYDIISGKAYKQIGRICMDMHMVDITGDDIIRPGDEVILWGGSGMSAEEVSQIVGTINYELTCLVTRRVTRLYINE